MAHFLYLKTERFSYLKAMRFFFFEVAHSRIWKRNIFCIWKWHIFISEMNAFSYLKKTHLSYLKMTHFSFLKIPGFRIWNRHFFVFAISTFSVFEIGTFFVFENGTYRILKLHIFDNKKALWQSKMENTNIRNVKFRGQRQTAKIWSEGFRVSRFQIWGNKVIWEMSTLEMSSSERPRTDSKNLKCSFQSFKISRFQIWGDKVTWGISTFEVRLRSKLCYNILIYVANIMSNLWQVTAHWDSWIVLWRSMIDLILIDMLWFDFELWIHMWIAVSLVNCKVDYANVRAVHKEALFSVLIGESP